MTLIHHDDLAQLVPEARNCPTIQPKELPRAPIKIIVKGGAIGPELAWALVAAIIFAGVVLAFSH